MKIQKVAALLLSMALTFSTCMPLNGIAALGAETGNTGVEASEQEEISDSAESTEIQQEEDLSSQTEDVETTAPEEDTSLAEENHPEEDGVENTNETNDENVQHEEETSEESNVSSDEEYESAAPAQEEDSSKGEERSMSGTKSNSAAEKPEDAAEETEPEEIEAFSNDVNQDFHAWPDGEDEYCSEKYITAMPGESVELKVSTSAEDPDSLSYTWYLDQEEIEGNNTDTLVTDPVNGYRYYSCFVHDQDGNSADIYFYISVENNLNAWPDGYEVGSTESYLYVSPGEPVELKVHAAADDDSSLSYTWYLDGQEIEGNSTDTLIIDSITEYHSYECCVSDQYRNSASVWFYAYAENHLTAWVDGEDEGTGYKDIFVSQGETVELKVVVAADDDSSLSYTWSRNEEEIEESNSDSLITDPVTEYQYYRCIIRDQYGNNASVDFGVSVENHLKVWPQGEDEETVNKDIHVSSGESVELKVNVTADDDSSLSYTWYQNGEEIEENNSDSLITDPVTEYRYYECKVRDLYNNSKSVTFYIYPESPIKAWPDGEWEGSTSKELYIPIGETAELKANVSAPEDSTLSYSWYLYGEEIEGENSDTLITEPVTEYREYCFEVRDQNQNYADVYFYVHVENHLNAYAKGGDEDSHHIGMGVAPGESVDLEVTVTANDDSSLSSYWFYNEETVAANTLSLHTDPIYESRDYEFKVYDQYENMVSVYFYIHVENNLDAYPADADKGSNFMQYDVEYNESKELKVVVSADDDDSLTYTWSKDGEEISGNNSDTLITGPITEKHEYDFTVSDQYGNSCGVHFEVSVANDLNAYPEGQDPEKDSIDVPVPAGESAELKVAVSARDKNDLRYIWVDYDNYEEVEGSDSFRIDSINSGRWVCVSVYDKYGNYDYVNFFVYVENHLTAYPEGGVQDPDENAAHIYVPEGETADLKVIVSADDESSLTYTWYEDWNEIEGRDSCTTSAIDYLKNYQFRVSDQFGNSVECYFYVHVENNLKAYPEGEDEGTDSATVYVGSGQKAELKACVSAQEDEGLNFHWYVEEKESEDNKWFSELEEETGLSCSTEAITEDKVYKFRVEDKYGNEKEVIFNVKVNDLEEQVISADDKMSLVYGNSGTISVSGAKGTLNYTSSDPAIASVDNSGKVTANKVGTAEITIFAEAAETCGQSNTITVTVNVTGASIDSAAVSGIVDKVYNGSAQTQKPVVKLGSTTLTEGTDYTVTYSNNTDAGTATVTITGKGNYQGTKKVTFKILPIGWHEEGGERYYYKEDGTRLTKGWAKDGSTWYWMDESGKITKSKWIQSAGKWYYMDSSGAMTTGWQQIGGKWYYMNSSGVMTTGWQQIGGKWYYMNSSGVMTTGWQQIGGKWYYMGSSGVMATGWQQIGGKWYYMNSSGVMTTGWQQIGGKWYYFNSSGVMTTGWQKIGGKWYYMNSSGQMLTGTQVIGGKTYVFNSSGVWIK